MEYKEATKKITEIIKAIHKGKYEVDFEEPSGIRECTAPDGRTFYKIIDMDGPKSSNDFGTCYVKVEGYTFSCDLETGEPHSVFFDELEEDYETPKGKYVTKEGLIEKIIDAFNERDDIWFCECTEMDSVMHLYAHIHGIQDPEYYWYEDRDCPKDVNSWW